MKNKRRLLTIFLTIPFFLFFSSCQKNSNPLTQTGNNTQNKIETGATVDVSTTTIGPGGGTIFVPSTGSPVDGMSITVPADAYTEIKTFSVSYTEIKSHQFGLNFNPASPIITIKNGGGYSSVPITVVIPIKKALDEFALGFLYNEVTGKLEALPLLAKTDSTVTVNLSHFETSSLSLGKSLFKRQDNANAQGNIIISSIKESILESQVEIDTKFKPGVDDWEFINYGSYIAPGGHCAGQSMSSMWYYYEKKLTGAPDLFHQYDTYCNSTNPSVLWQDNAWGYRFASTIQKDINWGEWILKVNIESYIPSLVWKSFIAAMLVTGEPQFVIIKESSSDKAHAMVVYKINISEGKLYIADPNFPNNQSSTGVSSIRTIDYAGGSFTPYPSSLNASSSQVIFDQIAFFGKTANIDWSKIGSRWTEFQNKTVGNDRFPACELFVQGAPDIPLTDGMRISQDTLKVYSKSTTAAFCYKNTDNWQRLKIFDTDGNLLCDNNADLGLAKLYLNSGTNKLGFYIMGFASDTVDHYVDFKWITVTKLGINSISPTHGVEGTTVTIEGLGFKPNQGTGYVQFNGVSTTIVSSWSDTLITVQVPQNATGGDVKVVVDGIASNGINFIVDVPTDLKGLDLTTKVQVMINGETIIGEQTNITDVGIANTDGFNTIGYSAYTECPLVWNGTTFRVKGVHVRSTYQRDSIYISGTVSSDGNTILSVDVAYRYYMVSSEDGSLEDEETFSYTLTNIPFYISYSGDYSFLTMSDLTSKVSNFSWRRWTKGSAERIGTFTSMNILSVNFE